MPTHAVRHGVQPARVIDEEAVLVVLPDVADVIRGEEEAAHALLGKAERDAKKLVSKMGMSGETLAVMHHTYGHDPETVATVIDVPPQMLAGYHAAMEMEKARCRAAQKKTVVTVKGLAV